jgi:putative restriction endonuclease
MLKAPIRKIGGYGAFKRYTDMTASEAWERYGLGNGVNSREELVERITAFALKRSKRFQASANPVIGCIELTDVIALDDDGFIVPEDYGHKFPPQIMKLKYFRVPDNLTLQTNPPSSLKPFVPVEGEPTRKPSRRKDRKGQSNFRLEILKNYGNKCSVLQEGIVELLEAAHIQPYIDERSNHAQNGICLRVDLHLLFDEGLLMITDDHHLRVSEKLKGTSYYELDGKPIALPTNPELGPSNEALAIHRRSFR